MLSCVLFTPATVVVDGYVDDSANKAVAETGSIVSWPEWIAVKTDRRESQLSEGARSSRTVDSLRKVMSTMNKPNQVDKRTNLR